jgi:hypothetical protein
VCPAALKHVSNSHAAHPCLLFTPAPLIPCHAQPLNYLRLTDACHGLFADVEAYKAWKSALSSRIHTKLQLPQHLLAETGLSKEQAGALERWMGSNDLLDVNYLSRGMAAAATVSADSQHSTQHGMLGKVDWGLLQLQVLKQLQDRKLPAYCTMRQPGFNIGCKDSFKPQQCYMSHGDCRTMTAPLKQCHNTHWPCECCMCCRWHA